MDHQAHGLDLDHPIFREPTHPKFKWTTAPREKQYEDRKSVLYPEGMADTCRFTDFEEDKPDGWNPILVSHEGFFTDIPGFENLAEGHSGKMLGSLSLARQGRYFYWGFSIDPQRMTAWAEDTFVNVIHYMYRKRHSLTVEYVCKTRRILEVYLELNQRSGYLRGIEEHLPGSLTEVWRETYDPSPDGCRTWLDRYQPYGFSGKSDAHRGDRYKTVFEVDADALALGTPNAERKSLERWIDLAIEGSGEERSRARRCLSRYIHRDIAPIDDGWRAWYEKYRQRIVFIESTGFWWQEDPRVLELEQAAARRALSGAIRK